jgi:hypothetical protein
VLCTFARLAFEHLGHQVFPDRPVGARELGHEPLGIRVTGERDHRQAQAGRPTFRALVQRGHPALGQADPGPSEQLARLALGEPEIAGSDLGDLVCKPELVQPDRRIPPRRQHHARPARQSREQTLELREGISRLQLVEIVDDQYDRSDLLGELRNDCVDELVAVNRSARGVLRLRVDRACRAANRVQNHGPKPLRILFVAVYRHRRDPTKVRRARSPRAQQRGLPAPRRRRDHRHPLGHGAIQHLKEIFPVQQAPGDRNIS